MDFLEDSRIVASRQMEELTGGSSRHLLIGIDVARKMYNAFFGTAGGKTLWSRLVFEKGLEGFEKSSN